MNAETKKDGITVLLNGSEVKSDHGMTVLELARKCGVYIPTLCHDPHLKPVGSCRLCVVEDGKSGALLASCVTPVAPGMVIDTESEKVLEARRLIVELLLSVHPDSCIVCDKGNLCRLRKIASELGIEETGLAKLRRYRPIESANPFIERDLSKCILCGKCIRGCREIEVTGAIDYAYRGFDSMPATPMDRPLDSSECEFCGLCVSLCPVGALSDKPGRYMGRPKESVPTVCPYCGSGCNINLELRDNVIVGVSPVTAHPVNRLSLCVKGRYGYDFPNSPDRLKTPLIRKDGKLVEAAWEEAIGLAARRLSRIKEQYGSDSLAIVGSLRCTNEDNYLIQKFSRAVVGTNNIDTMARLSSAPALETLETIFGFGAMSNSIEDIGEAGAIFVIGAQPTESLTALGREIKRAVKFNGAKLIVADPRTTKLARFADVHLKIRPGTDVALVNALMNVILSEGLAGRDPPEDIHGILRRYTPEHAGEITGADAEEIRRAAILYGGASRASIVFGTGIMQQTSATDCVSALANLALLTGNIGKRGGGITPVAAKNNLQGAWDMGLSPERLPGYQRLKDPAVGKKFEQQWGVTLPQGRGLTLMEMFEAAGEGKLKAMYVMGANPVKGCPDRAHVMDALGALDFLVVQDVFMNKTAEMADLVLPATGFAEKNGTFTSTERRVQRIRKALNPPETAMPDWRIITRLSAEMGYPMSYESPEDVMKEVALLTPIYGGISYERLKCGGLQWPCPDKNHLGTAVLYEEDPGKGSFRAVEYSPPAEMPDKEYPFVLIGGSSLYHSGTGTMSRRAGALGAFFSGGFVQINPTDAEKLKVSDRSPLRLTSRRGSLTVDARVTGSVPPGVLFMPMPSDINILTGMETDTASKRPAVKACAVNIKPVETKT